MQGLNEVVNESKLTNSTLKNLTKKVCHLKFNS
jgi:hypothetical protein